jgi:HSP20 family molecular chaperone IbpA
MEENRKHCILKFIGIMLASLLGAFLAFYLVIDMTIDRFTNPYYMMNRMDKMMMKGDNPLSMPAPMCCKHHGKMGHSVIEMVKKPDSYKFIVDLKPFRDNENSIHVTTNGSLITIEGEVSANTKNEEYFTQISQTFQLGKDGKLDKLSKKKVHDKYIITVPIED